ncbi:MAG: hypothetical protein Q9167_005197 [Letrouitia subvulpina]
MEKYEIYHSPLEGRYPSLSMKQLFSPLRRSETWRQLWLLLAESEKDLGLPISDEAIHQLRENIRMTEADFNTITSEEKRRKHDVMAHVHAFGQVATEAAGVIHWGATSCFVTDNADLIFLRDGFDILLPKLAAVIKNLSDFALEYKELPCLGYTHGQAAMPVTVGKRACVWIQDLLMDLRNLERARSDLRFRGVKGTTGTQSSFLQLFNGDRTKVEELDRLVTKKAGFDSVYTISTQTYSRHVDVDCGNALSAFGSTCQRVGGDLRHLAAFKEIEEPFEKDQIGSSAMAFKRNPMRSERMCSLGRQLVNEARNTIDTYAAQWLERSLDDSANRRTCLPEMFLLADALLLLLNNICSGLVVNPAVIKRRLDEEIPFMATEGIINRMTEKGGSRQEAHENIRILSHQAAAGVKQGVKNDLLERIQRAAYFAPIRDELPQLLDPKTFVGRAPEQVVIFVREEVEPALTKYGESISSMEVPQLHV